MLGQPSTAATGHWLLGSAATPARPPFALCDAKSTACLAPTQTEPLNCRCLCLCPCPVCACAEVYKARKESGLPVEQTVVVHAGFVQVEHKVGGG